MKAIIYPSELKGEITIPPSKSLTHRALIAASLSEGTSIIKNPLACDDTHATINALKRLGIDIQDNNKYIKIIGNKGNFKKKKETIFINCQESGTTLRFIASLSAISGNHVILDGTKRLRERPMGPLIKALKQLGVFISANQNNFLPIEIKPSEINQNEIILESNVSSQFVSSLLLISPILPNGLIIKTKSNVSKPYIELTVNVMKKFGINVNDTYKVNHQQYKTTIYGIEGDYSSASYFFAAKKIGKSDINIEGLNSDTIQGDSIFPEIIKNRKKEIDMSDYPDLVPTLSVVASFSEGITKIEGIGHLKHKESDRISSISYNLDRMGIKNIIGNDFLEIKGGKPKGAAIKSFNDHRIAMAFTIAALNADGKSTLDNTNCVMKSYPDFFRDIKKIGGRIQLSN